MDANGESLVSENCFHEIFENANPRKLCAVRYTKLSTHQYIILGYILGVL